MNKCKWEEGKFEACKNFNGIIYWRDFDNRKEYICSVCTADIRKQGSRIQGQVGTDIFKDIPKIELIAVQVAEKDYEDAYDARF